MRKGAQLTCITRTQEVKMDGGDTTMAEAQGKQPSATMEDTHAKAAVQGFHGVRYQVADVARSIGFYVNHLGFTLDHQQLPAFASVSLGGLRILLSGPGASGSRPMPDGRLQQSGGWNRVVLAVKNLPGLIDALRKAGLHFRNEMEVGPGGRQIQLEDPDGNAIELFEPAGSR
jgi:glyoxylase I family protein